MGGGCSKPGGAASIYRVLEPGKGVARKGNCEDTSHGFWHLPQGGIVVALADFDPGIIHWPPHWGEPALRLHTSLAIKVLRDDGGERAFGHPLHEPHRQGYFLKHYVEPLGDGSDRSTTAGSTTTGGGTSLPSYSTPSSPASSARGAWRRVDGEQHVLQNAEDAQNSRIVGPTGIFAPFHGSEHVPSSAPTAVNTAPRSELVSSSSPLVASTATRAEAAADSSRVVPKQRFLETSGKSEGLLNTSTQRRSNAGKITGEAFIDRSFKGGREDELRPRATLLQTPVAQKDQKFLASKYPPEVLKAAKELTLDIQNDGEFMWLAEIAATAPLPDGWVDFVDDAGRSAFYHPKLKRVSRQHPMLIRYRNFVEKLKAFRELTAEIMHKKVKPHIAVLLNEVMNRCHRDLPPVTPELIERFSVLLCINTNLDHRLTRRIKMAVEIYAEDQYDVAIQANQKVDIDGFLAMIRNEQVDVEVREKPEGTIMCSEIEGSPAVLKCEQCYDFFSLEGFARTHNGGKRKEHTTLKCEQLVCSIYPQELAAYEVDRVLLSERGYSEAVAKNPALQQKRRKLIGGINCSEQKEMRAEVLCEDCCDLFCWEAFLELHAHGHRQRHVPLKLDAAGFLYRAGDCLSPEETAKLISRARIAREGGPWLAFKDDQLNTYWYHLSDKIVTHQNPYM